MADDKFETLDPPDDLDFDSPDDRIVREAKERFQHTARFEADARKNFINDLKFSRGDSENMYQWPDAIQTARGFGTISERPCLTINKIRQHNLQIINDAKQNKPSIKVKPVGNGATYESAQIYEGIVRHIEYISNAQSAYDWATTMQVEGGIGYFRIATDYADDQTFDQEIFIRRVKDALSVYLDPHIQESDGSDANFCIIFDKMAKDEAKKAYPKYASLLTHHPLNADYQEPDWVDDDEVVICEYFRKVKKTKRLIGYQKDEGEPIMVPESEIDKKLLKAVLDNPQTKYRDIVATEVEWYLIIGNKIAERSVWPGKYIPIVRVIGEEVVIQGKLDRKGHTRNMKDPQRIYNYWSSSAVEHVALQSKTPYIGMMDAFSNLETYWDTANTVNHAWLPYNGYDEKGQKLDAPQRQAPPVMSEAYIKGMAISSEDINSVSGQYQAELGMPSNERSGTAIQQRQRQGDNATYHFIDNLAMAIRYAGKIVIDLIPKIYDTQRVIKIMAEDGAETEVQIDPNAQQAFLQKQKQTKDEIDQVLFNPNVGKYNVEADVGPAYATRRQEAFNAFTQISSQNKDFMNVAGDLFFKAADFPMANELAERYRRMIPPQLLGDGPTPQEQQTQAMIKNLDGMLAQALQENAELKNKQKVEEQQKEIDIYKAVTDRLSVMLKTVVTPQMAATFAHDLVKQEHAANVSLAKASGDAEIGLVSGAVTTAMMPPEPQQPEQATAA